MDGYTVKEAAAALGVPKKRVWELVARGVLNGRREGDRGMRVYLQPSDLPDDDDEGGHPERSGRTDAPRTREPVARPAPVSEPIVEASPFRELLTEFRNLTERYGQALLALGEARGEVAALRSRVELLEARMDLRLPGGAPIPPVSWRTPEPIVDEPIAPPLEPEAAGTGDADAADAHPVDEEPARGRRGRRRLGGPGILEALARAEDPALAELPGAREAGEAMAAFDAEAASAEESATPSEPPPRVPAEPEPEPEPAQEVDAHASSEPPVEATPGGAFRTGTRARTAG